jgi:hypothetical protein
VLASLIRRSPTDVEWTLTQQKKIGKQNLNELIKNPALRGFAYSMSTCAADDATESSCSN